MASQFPLKKNTAAKLVFPIYDADGDLVSGAADLDSEYSLGGGGFTNCASEAIEINTSGVYYLDLTADETNGDVVVIQVKTSTSGAKTTVLVFYTAGGTVDELGTLVNAVSAKVDGLESTVEGLTTTVDELGTLVNAVSAKVDGLESTVEGLTTTLDELRITLNLLKTVFVQTV